MPATAASSGWVAPGPAAAATRSSCWAELGTVDGVADIGFALAAWFVDPHHNWIGLLQFKEPVR
jgi:hypothetical protein